MVRKYYILFLILCCVACSPRALQESQHTIAQADSLRQAGQMYGIDAGDSATLAQAYETLGSLSLFNFHFSPSYANACYHYGRLLREKNDPVSAMQVFINATHSGTKDYHILGRVYSNMGNICHFAGNYPMSYDMFMYSAELFKKNNDTTAYLYALNDMAFETAMLADKPTTLSLLDKIEFLCTDADILTKLLETKAELYLHTQQYDTALYYASCLCNQSDRYPIAKLIQAQVYSIWGIKDSAVLYAEQVLDCSSDLSDMHNALYILTNDDERKNEDAIRETAADRSDLQKILRVQQGKLSQATQLLHQDLTRKPDLRWLYAILITMSIMGLSIWAYVFVKRKKHKLLSQQVLALEELNHSAQNQYEQIRQEHIEYRNNVISQIEKTCSIFRESPHLQKDLCWFDYHKMCQIVDQLFYMLASKLTHKGNLNETEVRLCILVLLNMSRSEIADTLPYALSSIGKLKDQTAKSLGTTGKKLREYLINMAVEG